VLGISSWFKTTGESRGVSDFKGGINSNFDPKGSYFRNGLIPRNYINPCTEKIIPLTIIARRLTLPLEFFDDIFLGS
jgi:hypothetical protein